ncbi:archaetidylserine decarboxylase [Aestuariibacter halophilus]|uniref:Phosphatidylserine decarboxylase proenzyme n=1 Tax=Fluctibacter halophilus TaxID=226011 RepID=A0ABS8G9T4_9ALTE|nr:archaetidylserine decarboxylase [Aestuariibacter halophilus]MCC2617339.1 archaetidylserine decarboxylase [Aestuariibacter halophilus]
MINWLKVRLQYVLPKHLLSRLVGTLAAAKAGRLTTALIKAFIKQYRVDMSEAVLSDPEDYATFNDFFTRELRPGLRPFVEDDKQLGYPVDGTVSQLGPIDQDRVFQAKGHDYSLTTLLGGNPDIAAPFIGGEFATIYLSPRDYHRIHMPMDAVLTDMLYVPGELFSVNPLTTENVPGLFARNERVVCVFDTAHGKMAMVLVGATIVASIETVWAGTVTPPAGQNVQHWRYPTEGEHAIRLNKGDEMGRFKLGSTVVACFAPDMLAFDGQQAGDVTRLGELFATLKA